MGVKFLESATEKRNAELYDKYVPHTGKADTVGGEILRAWNRVGYRYLNDGDICGVGYGRETVNPAARWLASKVQGLEELEELASHKDDEPFVIPAQYEEMLGRAQEKVIGMLDVNPGLFEEANTEDCLDAMREDWDEELPEEEDEWM